MNRVCLVGQLSGPPRVRVEGQVPLTAFTLEVLEPSRAAASFTLFVPCVAWGPAAETAGLLHAEDVVCVQGRLCGRHHRDTHGHEQRMLAVTVYTIRMLQAPGGGGALPERPVGGGEKCE